MSEPRFLIVPCGEDTGLSIIWDRAEECVIDVVDAKQVANDGDPQIALCAKENSND